jgi:TNF receptor-associated factor 4
MACGEGEKYEFIDDSQTDEYICPICTHVLCDPQQTRCGHLICKSCIMQLKDKGNNFTCPTCCTNLTDDFFPDESANHKIQYLQVRCKYECLWMGDYKDIKDHIKSCPYQFVSCSYCERKMLRKLLQNHLDDYCPKRLIKCQYCNEEGAHEVITGPSHVEECQEYPIKCTNYECTKKISRKLMLSHRESCPKEMTSCEYKKVGCEEKVMREEQVRHNEERREEHLQLAVDTISKLRNAVSLLRMNSNGLRNIVKFTNFTDHNTKSTVWYSPGFYTSLVGYRMCLRVDANGCGDVIGTHASCFIYLMSGEFDDILQWPFHGKVVVELLNQLEDKSHYEIVIPFNQSTPLEYKSRVFNRERAERCWGCHKFMSHSHLESNQQFLKNDTLFFRVSVKSMLDSNIPWLV